MTTGEVLYDRSTLNNGTALEHFLSMQGSVAGETLINVVGLYDVEYLGEENNIVSYLGQEKISVEYIDNETLEIEYLGEEDNLITYIPPGEIKIDYSCQQ